MNIAFVAAGAVALVGGIIVALPAWRRSRDRSTQLANEERYLAWRGRADRVAVPSPGPADQRRLRIGAALVLIGAACLLIGLTAG